jgi:hypothetical protein
MSHVSCEVRSVHTTTLDSRTSSSMPRSRQTPMTRSLSTAGSTGSLAAPRAMAPRSMGARPRAAGPDADATRSTRSTEGAQRSTRSTESMVRLATLALAASRTCDAFGMQQEPHRHDALLRLCALACAAGSASLAATSQPLSLSERLTHDGLYVHLCTVNYGHRLRAIKYETQVGATKQHGLRTPVTQPLCSRE